MDEPGRGAVRALRAMALAVLVLAMSTTAHALVGGVLPSAPLLGAIAVVVACAALVAAHSQWTRARAVVLLGVGQYALHHLLMLLSGAHSATGSSAVGNGALGAGGSAHHAAPALWGDSAAPTVAALHDAASPLMIGAHAAATVVAASLLAGADRVAWELRSWLAPLALPTAPAVLLVTPRRPARAPLPVVAPLCLVRARSAPRRGPPPVLRRLTHAFA